MSTGSVPSSPFVQSSAQVEKALRAEAISVTLKFGFQQKLCKYPLADGSTNQIIDRIYRDAESWLRSIAVSSKTLQIVDRYTLYLLRIPTTDLTMVPITQLSDIEQNCLIELVVAPVEINQNPHALYRCQLNFPTNCSKCSRLISGIYRQGLRCRNCRMTYHKDCAPFLLDDCSVPVDPPTPGPKKSGTNTLQPSQPVFVNPFVSAPASTNSAPVDPANTSVPIYTTSANNSKADEPAVVSTTIIDEGIFPVAVTGTGIYRRYLFLLTSSTLKLTSNLSTVPTRTPQIRQATDVDVAFPLAEVKDLVLTHCMDDQDHIFQIHFHRKFVLCVGKKSDSDDLQMQTAQFYSSIRDQWEASATGSTPTQVSSTPTSAANVATGGQLKSPNGLMRKTSVYRRPPCGRDNEDKDLHELYAFTGEKIGEGMQTESDALLLLLL